MPSQQLAGAGDPIAGAAIGIDTIHARIHNGTMFTASIAVAALADDAHLDLLILAASPIHLRGQGACGGDAEVRIYENCVASADGTPVVVTNRNRLSEELPNALLFSAPTISDLGDLVAGPSVLPGGSGNQATGVTGEIFEEIIMRAGDYLLRLTNRSERPRIAGLEIAFYHA